MSISMSADSTEISDPQLKEKGALKKAIVITLNEVISFYPIEETRAEWMSSFQQQMVELPTANAVVLLNKQPKIGEKLWQKDYSINIFLRQMWIDTRLQYDDIANIKMIELDPKIIDSVWVPDSFFYNEKFGTFHNITVPNKLMHLYNNGSVVYSMRLSLRLSCFMNLEKYPLDHQICPLVIESYGYSTGNVMYYWKQNQGILVSHEFRETAQFILKDFEYESACRKDYGDIGKFACITANFVFERNIGYYMLQVYVPGVLIVILSWVSFWIDVEAIPARVSLGVLTVLTMTTQSTTGIIALPKVSYIKAIDVWNSTCLFFVFASLLEFAYVNVLNRTRRRSLSTRSDCRRTSLSAEEQKTSNGHQSSPSVLLGGEGCGKSKARKVDRMSRILFPSTFTAFNVIYWAVYTQLKSISR